MRPAMPMPIIIIMYFSKPNNHLMYKNEIVSCGADIVDYLRYFASFEFIDRKFVAPYAE